MNGSVYKTIIITVVFGKSYNSLQYIYSNKRHLLILILIYIYTHRYRLKRTVITYA